MEARLSRHAFERWKIRVDPEATFEEVKAFFEEALAKGRYTQYGPRELEMYLFPRGVIVGAKKKPGVFYIVTVLGIDKPGENDFVKYAHWSRKNKQPHWA